MGSSTDNIDAGFNEMTHTTVSDNQVSNVLESAAARLERDGWLHGEEGSGDGACCAAKAIIDAELWLVDYRTSEAYRFFAKVVGVEYVHEWNDAPERTQAEVVAKLREAAQLAKAGQ